MTENKYRHHRVEGSKVPAFLWDSHLTFEDNVVEQIDKLTKLPFIHHHVSLMPDGHLGYGSAVGSVIVTEGRVIMPSAVGKDIGCGMVAVKTSAVASDLPDDLHALRTDIEKNIPVGSSPFGRKVRDESVWGETPQWIYNIWKSELKEGYDKIIERNPKINAKNTHNQLGTLGSGNHFIEICLDEEDNVWIMLHSGSRGSGNRIGTFFTNKAMELIEKNYISHWIDKDHAYLIDDPKNPEDLFSHYIGAMFWGQKFARINRDVMLKITTDVLQKHVKKPFTYKEEAINCHHNYCQMEHHFGKNVWTTRKGAISAKEGELGIIPGSMATGSYIVKGLGNEMSFHSCSHGAGRVMSRNQAKKEISLEQHIKDTEGVECRKDDDVRDESPRAYKKIEDVMEAQSDLVSIEAKLTQIVNVKG